MSAHNHTSYVPGCFRCDLSRAELPTAQVDLETDCTDAGHPNIVAVPGPMVLACIKCGAFVAYATQHADWHDLIEGNIA